MPKGFLKIRAGADAEARWRAAANGNLSAWLRGVADLAATGGVDPAEVRDALVGFRADLNKGVGNNLNQIARALNSDLLAGQQPSANACEAAMTRAADELATMRAALQQALDGLAPRRRPPRASRPVPASPSPVMPG